MDRLCPSCREEITELRCKMLRAENVKFWGDRSFEMTRCPCEREKKVMAKGRCSNCERYGVNLQPGTGRCCQCSKYITGTRYDPESRNIKLAEAKELYGNLKPGERKPVSKERKTDGKIGLCTECGRDDKRIYGSRGISRCGRCKSAFYNKSKSSKNLPTLSDDLPAQAHQSPPLPETKKTTKGYDTPDKTEHIILTFLDITDREILEFLQMEAQRCRRSVEQQAMWLLQSHLPDIAKGANRDEPNT